MKNIRSCVIIFLMMSLLTGVAYPLLVTVIGRGLFKDEAQGSLILIHGQVRGSKLIGQRFRSPAYFWSRPSASEYGALPSSASNLAPTSDALKRGVEERRSRLSQSIASPIPADLLFSSGSGLDPHISPEAALAQVDHVAKARGLRPEEKVKLLEMVKQHIETPQLGILGSPCVNVLDLNLALDDLFGSPAPQEK